MAEKTLGYVELEWTCPRCGTKNPGTLKTCSSCGTPMAAGDQFELPSEQVLITDPGKIPQAASAPDRHCPYCGARNVAAAAICTQCGGDLKEGQARQKGTVMGAFQAGPAKQAACPACGTPNPANAARCQSCGGSLQRPAAAQPVPQSAVKAPRKGILAGAGVLLALICLALAVVAVLSLRTTQTTGTVQKVQWERTIAILEERPVERQDWEDQLPEGAQSLACTQKVRTVQSDPAPGAEEVCGTPYTVDEGSGVGRVVQDCEYHIYASWCTYTVGEWQVVDSVVAQGKDFNPFWPQPDLLPGQRTGDRSETYTVTFSSGPDQQFVSYSLGASDVFSEFTLGSVWNLDINTFGKVVSVQPK